MQSEILLIKELPKTTYRIKKSLHSNTYYTQAVDSENSDLIWSKTFYSYKGAKQHFENYLNR